MLALQIYYYLYVQYALQIKLDTLFVTSQSDTDMSFLYAFICTSAIVSK